MAVHANGHQRAATQKGSLTHSHASRFWRCQVYTPPEVVSTFWSLLKQHRSSLESVVDLGAGDGRFAVGGFFKSYLGIELDKGSAPALDLPRNAKLVYDCAFAYRGGPYSACVGNPPYLRHHDLTPKWRDKIWTQIKTELGLELDQRANLFAYFMSLGLMRAAADGLVAQLVPFEWVSRPSTQSLRNLIHQKKWAVSIYRFSQNIFDDVLTTASITIIDKGDRSGKWSYFDIAGDSKTISRRKGETGTKASVLPYEDRGELWAMRGLSPGSQSVFVLTEDERSELSLSSEDVSAAVTSLKHVPSDITDLSSAAFHKYFVESGRRCWLVRSDRAVSRRLYRYLYKVPSAIKRNHTCKTRTPWYRFRPHPIPNLLFSSGFVKRGPKVMVNSIRATPIGAVTGIYANGETRWDDIRAKLATFDFESAVIAYAKTLKKVEIGQLNSVLRAIGDGSQADRN